MDILGFIIFSMGGAFIGWLLAPLLRGDSYSKLNNIATGIIGGLVVWQYIIGLTSANLYLTIGALIGMILSITIFVAQARN